MKNADSWFDEEETPQKSSKYTKQESSDSDLEIIDVTPAKQQKPKIKFEPKTEAKIEYDSEEDPLDAFMSGIEKTAKRQISQARKKDELNLPDDKTISGKGVRDDIENLDDEEQYFKWIDENPEKNFADPEYASLSKEAREYLQDDEAEELINYDEQGHMHVNVQKKDIECLPVVYHSQVDYPAFGKNFYREDSFIKEMSLLKAFELIEKLELKVDSSEPVEKPVCSFAHFERSFHPDMFKIIRKQKFTSPTAIQAQALPSALSGRDIIGIAKTGSGKTVAFCWPAIVHAAAQQRKPKDGPIVLIISPTRELCLQTYEEIKKYACVYNLKCIPLYGGGTMWEQAKHCQKIKPEIVIGTPGRIMDHVRKNNISLKNVTLFTLDEADRMFDMGFEYQVRSICDQIRPDRQGLLFSATFPNNIKKLCKDVLQPNYVSITAGDGPGQVNKSICQMVRICDSFQSKLAFVNQNYVGWTSAGGLLIFVTKKEESEKVGKMLKERHERGTRPEIGIMHGDMTQFVRNDVLHKFRLRQINCLVATDVCARGLDISHIRNVVCFTAARKIDTHVHRVGRTGRAGNSGRAYILLDQTSKNDIDFTESMIEYLQKYSAFNKLNSENDKDPKVTKYSQNLSKSDQNGPKNGNFYEFIFRPF